MHTCVWSWVIFKDHLLALPSDPVPSLLKVLNLFLVCSIMQLILIHLYEAWILSIVIAKKGFKHTRTETKITLKSWHNRKKNSIRTCMNIFFRLLWICIMVSHCCVGVCCVISCPLTSIRHGLWDSISGYEHISQFLLVFTIPVCIYSKLLIYFTSWGFQVAFSLGHIINNENII